MPKWHKWNLQNQNENLPNLKYVICMSYIYIYIYISIKKLIFNREQKLNGRNDQRWQQIQTYKTKMIKKIYKLTDPKWQLPNWKKRKKKKKEREVIYIVA